MSDDRVKLAAVGHRLQRGAIDRGGLRRQHGVSRLPSRRRLNDDALGVAAGASLLEPLPKSACWAVAGLAEHFLSPAAASR
jgi:hypothetical protein